MAKLKCSKHDRRIHVIRNKAIHRDGTKCGSLWVYIGAAVYKVTAQAFHYKPAIKS